MFSILKCCNHHHHHHHQISKILIYSFHSSSSIECYYQTLGILRNASDTDIRSAYIQMAKKYHPDVNTQINSTETFSKINEAYSTLSDKLKKQDYDRKIGNKSFHNNTKKNWWDFDFYDNSSSPSSPYERDRNDTTNDDKTSDFEFAKDFYGDFSRFTGSNNTSNTKKRKRNADNNNYDHKNNHNPYADYYYYYQQINNNNNNNSNKKSNKYGSNIWSEFEFEFDISEEFDSEFNNEGFYRFLRNNNKKHRVKYDNNKQKEKEKQTEFKEKEKEKEKEKQKAKEKEFKAKEKEKEKKATKQSNKNDTNAVSNNDIELNLTLNFLESVNGCTRNISFNRNEICTSCGGTSYELGGDKSSQCIKCSGSGIIYGYGSNDFITHKCVNCSGSGIIFKNCNNCLGKTVINLSKSLTINIPSGIRNNDRVRVSRQGNQFVDYKNNNVIKYGHIWINCRVLNDDYFIRRNNDIHITMNIPYCLAVLGGSFVVPTIYGPNVIKLLPGIQSGDYDVIENKGVFDSSANKKGNQYIHFIINIPNQNDINEEQKKLLCQYAKLETPPKPVKTSNIQNLKHFKKYGHKVNTFSNNETPQYHYDNNDHDKDQTKENNEYDKFDNSSDNRIEFEFDPSSFSDFEDDMEDGDDLEDLFYK